MYVIYLKRSGCLNPSLAEISYFVSYFYLFLFIFEWLSSLFIEYTFVVHFWGNTIHRPPMAHAIVTHKNQIKSNPLKSIWIWTWIWRVAVGLLAVGHMILMAVAALAAAAEI